MGITVIGAVTPAHLSSPGACYLYLIRVPETRADFIRNKPMANFSETTKGQLVQAADRNVAVWHSGNQDKKNSMRPP